MTINKRSTRPTEQQAIVPAKRPVDLASMPRGQDLIEDQPHEAPVRRLPHPDLDGAMPPSMVYWQQSYSYREISYSSRTTYYRGGVPMQVAPAGLPAAESEAAHFFVRGLQLILWISVVGIGGYFSGRALGWW